MDKHSLKIPGYWEEKEGQEAGASEGAFVMGERDRNFLKISMPLWAQWTVRRKLQSKSLLSLLGMTETYNNVFASRIEQGLERRGNNSKI